MIIASGPGGHVPAASFFLRSVLLNEMSGDLWLRYRRSKTWICALAVSYVVPERERRMSFESILRRCVQGPRVALRGMRNLFTYLRKFRRWVENAEKIDLWVANSSEIDRWFEHRDAISEIMPEEARKHKLPQFRRDFERFSALSRSVGRELPVSEADLLPCLDDSTAETAFDRHYLYHPAWAARILAQTRPSKHTDVSSILSFSMVLSAFLPVDFYDIRPAAVKLSDFVSRRGDLLALPFVDESIESLSCMHVIEHVGLGRYGDPLDPNGDLKAIKELIRVLAPGGNLLIATPVGTPRIRFNAHRIYDHLNFWSYFSELELVEFSLIPDGPAPDGMIRNPPAEFVQDQSYACGCYWFRKPL